MNEEVVPQDEVGRSAEEARLLEVARQHQGKNSETCNISCV